MKINCLLFFPKVKGGGCGAVCNKIERLTFNEKIIRWGRVSLLMEMVRTKIGKLEFNTSCPSPFNYLELESIVQLYKKLNSCKVLKFYFIWQMSWMSNWKIKTSFTQKSETFEFLRGLLRVLEENPDSTRWKKTQAAQYPKPIFTKFDWKKLTYHLPC